uniref:Uncharacterized protein n=1 Tax=Sparus aurata TaxID=8175 RepID=A0A671Y2H8_SPAAU
LWEMKEPVFMSEYLGTFNGTQMEEKDLNKKERRNTTSADASMETRRFTFPLVGAYLGKTLHGGERIVCHQTNDT